MPGKIIPRHMQQEKEKYSAKTPSKAAAEKKMIKIGYK